jgi:hypothetical protein
MYTGMERALVTATMEAADTVRAFEYVEGSFLSTTASKPTMRIEATSSVPD